MAEYTVTPPPPDLHLFGGEWLERGYVLTTAEMHEPGPCEVCGAPNQTCIGEQNHG